MELLRDRRAAFDEVGVEPVGVSRDSPWTHIAWSQALDLNFGLLSDWNGDATRARRRSVSRPQRLQLASSRSQSISAGSTTLWHPMQRTSLIVRSR